VLGFVRVAYETLTYMDTIPRFLLALFLLAVTFAPGCVGGGVFFKERLVGRFAMWAVDGLSDNSVVEESEDGRAARVLIPATVFAVGFNDQFVIAKRHPKSDHQIDSSTTEFYVVSVLDGHVHGPVDYENFSALRARLGVPASLDFSRVIEQLAHQPSNTQQKSTVGFGLAIYRTISLTND
jgi:hypothetical protein